MKLKHRLPLVLATLIALDCAGGPAPQTTIVPKALAVETSGHMLMPVPASLDFGTGTLAIRADFRVSFTGYIEPRLERAAERMVEYISRMSGIPIGFGLDSSDTEPALTIETDGPAEPIQSPMEDESYSLTVTVNGARLHAATPYGVLRGLQTFRQLVEEGGNGFRVRAVAIYDRPRFPWRGLLMDVARHWMPPHVIKRNLDAMAAVKLNVLHWHLSEDQGFRIESKEFPELHGLGSDGYFYTQNEVREIIEYARDRGIRVVPEFDMPGHSTSWFVGHPELASAQGPYEIERHWGIMDPAMDPTTDELYDFLDRFIGEMSELFPDRYFHIGGDEVNGHQWKTNERIQQFMRDHDIADEHDLQTYFNRRLSQILSRHQKKMIGWDEIFRPGLPQDAVVQSWRGQEALAQAARAGYQGILSNGYYLDHIRPASFHYSVDPLGGDAAGLTADEQARVLGGEACMWAEYITAANVDSRIWPRAAAIAERLWSPASASDADDMYYRLKIVSQRLEWLGLTHRSSYAQMLRRLTNYRPIDALKTLSDVTEPVKFLGRANSGDYTSLTPLNRLVDATRPESDRARTFNSMIGEMLADRSHATYRETVRYWLTRWHENHDLLTPDLEHSNLLQEVTPLSAALTELAELGLSALDKLDRRKHFSSLEYNAALEILERTGKPQADLLIMVVPGVRRLVEAVGRKR